MAALDVGDEAVDALHRVERQGGLLLQGAQRAVEVVLFQVLHDQADHAGGRTGCVKRRRRRIQRHRQRGSNASLSIVGSHVCQTDFKEASSERMASILPHARRTFEATAEPPAGYFNNLHLLFLEHRSGEGFL